ncbi:hypothetical protein PSHT_01873, partial [Puccinia striiformis]
MAAAPLPPCSILRLPSTTSGSVPPMSNSSLECLNNPRSILDFPAEILTIIAIELVMNQPSQRYRALKTNQLGNLLQLLNFGLTCKHLHSICQRIYQKQVVLTLPSTKHTSSQLSQQSRRDQRERAHRPSGQPYARTIETHDSVAKGWSGAHNVNWLFISNQASYEPKYSAMFAGLISSTARLARSFRNLRFLCLSRLNNETIMLCLERGVGKSLQALSITLSEVEDSGSSLRGLANRIMRLRTISHLEAIQVNDIEPTWVGLINQVDNLKELSLHITNFTPKIVQLLDSQDQSTDVGGLRRSSRHAIGPFILPTAPRKFPKIEVLKCGLHFVGLLNDYHGEVSHYATALARFSYLRQFVFNHFNSPQLLEYFDGSSATESVFQKFRSYSEPYLHESQSLQELISIDFLDRNSMSGISAQKTHSGSDNRRITTNSCTKSDRADSNGVLKVLRLDEYPCGLMLKTSHEPISRSADKNPERSGRPSIRMRKIHDVRDTIMVSFEHRWAKID